MASLLECLDLNDYRDSADMTSLPMQNGYGSRVLLFFDSTIANIVTAVLVNALHRDQLEVKV